MDHLTFHIFKGEKDGVDPDLLVLGGVPLPRLDEVALEAVLDYPPDRFPALGVAQALPRPVRYELTVKHHLATDPAFTLHAHQEHGATTQEHRATLLLDAAYEAYKAMAVEDKGISHADLKAFDADITRLQQAVLSRVASRAHPNVYR